MTGLRSMFAKIVLALAAAAALLGALVLTFFAAFPYVFAESGSASYAERHRVEAFLQFMGAGALLVVAWWCIRHSFSARGWLVMAGVLIAAVFATRVTGSLTDGLIETTRKPANVQPVGGDWHVVAVPHPGEIDTVSYRPYLKRGLTYRLIEDLAAEYRYVAPDCLTYRGLKVVGRPMYAMCGYRAPVETYDTTATEAELLDKARSRPPFRHDWRTVR